MSGRYLGETFDIHGGGLDLIFPHHENEIAQSRCAHGTPVMANVWMHNGFLQVEGRKMSKSEGNFVTIHDLLETEKFGGRKWPGEVLRLAMLMTHYREPIDFSVSRLEEASSLWTKWGRWIDNYPDVEAIFPTKIAQALADDLNVAAVFRLLSELSVGASGATFGGGDSGPSDDNGRSRRLAVARLKGALDFLGVSTVRTDDERSARIARQLVDLRLAALAARDFAKADAIRAELLEQGIQLMDYKDPATGERRTKWEVKR
jgi:cysteinyl-tRNA synthetase